MEKYQIEICTNSVESCLAAQEGGANRVELCAGIPEGGTTPSYGEIAIAREVLTHTRLHVIIRPRGGDFLYSDIEIRTMLKDIEIARRLGADGVVFGCLTADGEVDLTSMQILMEASKGLSVTFHRAFDVCRNPQKALEEIIELADMMVMEFAGLPAEECEIEIIGLCTDICVVSNALILKARLPEVKISVDASCCAGVRPESHAAALQTMQMCQIHVR